MKKILTILLAAWLFAHTGAAQFLDVSYPTPSIYMEDLPLCSSDFFSYRYEHPLPMSSCPVHHINALLTVHPFNFNGRVDTLFIGEYYDHEEFGVSNEKLEAWFRCVFDHEGRVSEIDPNSSDIVSYFFSRRAYMVTDGNLRGEIVEYDDEGRVTRRYPKVYRHSGEYMDYFYDAKGRVERIVFYAETTYRGVDHIITFRYTYMTRESMTDYISTIECFRGTKRMYKAEYDYAANGRLRQVCLENTEYGFQERRLLYYQWDEDGTLLAHEDVSKALSDGKLLNRHDFNFSWCWGNGFTISRSLDINRVYNPGYGAPNETNEMFNFIYDERGNWTEFEWGRGKFVRIFSYSSAPGPSDGVLCLACGKHMGVHTAFCPECGAQQILIASEQSERFDHELRVQDALSNAEISQQTDDRVQNGGESANADVDVTITEEEDSFISFWVFFAVAVAVLVAWFVKRRRQ